MEKPFVKGFKIGDNYYVYDVNTNEFFKVDELSYSFIIGENKKINILNKYSSEQIKKIKNEIAFMKLKGYFSSNRPEIRYFRTEKFKRKLKEALYKNLKRITLVVTENCNLKCEYCVYSGCYYYHRRHSTKNMSLSTMRKAIDFYLKNSYGEKEKNIGFYGGEPLLNFELIKECVKYIKKQCSNSINFHMTTNATLLDKSKIQFLAKNNFALLISLDGPKDINDRYRISKNRKGTFDIVMKNLKLILLMYPEYYRKKVRINMVLAPPYDFEKINNFITSNEIIRKTRSIKCSLVSKKDNSFYERFNPLEREKQIKDFFNIFNDFNDRLCQNKPFKKLEKILFERRYYYYHKRDRRTLPSQIPSHGQCTLGERGILINADGSINFCSQVEDVFNLGDVHSGYYFDKILNLYHKLEDLYSKYCYNCWAIRFCFKCIKDLNAGGKIHEELFKKICSANKERIYNDIVMYIKIREKNYCAFDFLNKIELK